MASGRAGRDLSPSPNGVEFDARAPSSLTPWSSKRPPWTTRNVGRCGVSRCSDYRRQSSRACRRDPPSSGPGPAGALVRRSRLGSAAKRRHAHRQGVHRAVVGRRDALMARHPGWQLGLQHRWFCQKRQRVSAGEVWGTSRPHGVGDCGEQGSAKRSDRFATNMAYAVSWLPAFTRGAAVAAP